MPGLARSIALLLLALAAVQLNAGAAAFRPPAVPLVTSDPYLSVWSEADRLTDDATRHWTGRRQSLDSLIRIDGKAYRLMGVEPAGAPAMAQVRLQVLPTRSVYDFETHAVHVTLTFMTPALPHDLDVLTRPLTYLTWSVRSVDGRPHAIQLYDGTSSELAVNLPIEAVIGSRERLGRLTAMHLGTVDQPILQTSGDSVRIDWGYVYAAAPGAASGAAIGDEKALAETFAGRGRLPASGDARRPRAVSDGNPTMGFAFDLGEVGPRAVSRHVMVAYDERYAIKYFGARLRPYWRRHGETAAGLLQAAERDYPELARRCAAFDSELMADLGRVGGSQYAQLCALAYRQALAGTGTAADAFGQPLLFTKENTSNGDIATVDVIYPMEPILLLLSPALAKAALVPDLDYAASSHWRFPFAPHDLGTYPVVSGRDEGGEIMEVEESGNMILLLAAVAKSDGTAAFASHWWPQVTRWAEYIRSRGFDLPNQLTTDDFAGPSAHNANLAIKAIEALDAYGMLCDMRGSRATGRDYHRLARRWAASWVRAADDGDHFRLAYDRPGSWSQKYNLVWDRILGLDVFPPRVARREIAFYRTVMNRYGLPLDSRKAYTKTDWTLWTAALADRDADFRFIVSRVVDFLDATPSRVPFSDFYWTRDARDAGMHARPVIGGVFVRMLADAPVWRKWAARGRAKVGPWAPLPTPPTVTEVVPTARRAPVEWRYTTDRPAGDWMSPGFDDSRWDRGTAGFGTAGTPGILARTRWATDDLWMRREFTMPAGAHPGLQLLVYHDEDVEIYVNGVLAARESGFVTDYELMEIRPAARALLRPGSRITLAVHCHQTTGGQGVDVGLVESAPTRSAAAPGAPRRSRSVIRGGRATDH